MSDKHTVMEQIHTAFQGLAFPGEGFLQASFEGTEPYDEVAPFRGQTNWQTLEATFLDAHASALSFFSEAGFRFFLPAYLLADLNDQLQTADPVFHLTHGFFEFSVTVPAGGRVFVRKSGKSVLINPRRYGAMTVSDYARYRLSIFTAKARARWSGLSRVQTRSRSGRSGFGSAPGGRPGVLLAGARPQRTIGGIPAAALGGRSGICLGDPVRRAR